jgi:hypothetical protein
MKSDSTANVVPFPNAAGNQKIDANMTEIALQIRAKALEKWGVNQAVEVVGLSQKMRETLDKVQKFRQVQSNDPDHR